MKRKLGIPVCIAILLLSSLAHAATTRPATRPFAAQIAAYERQDEITPPPTGATLFVGSSTFAMWGKKLPEDFKPMVAINRGFGGSTTADVLYYMDRIVLPYKPKVIVMYCGENDIAGRKKAEDVLENFKVFVSRAQAALPDVKIYYVSMKPSPSRAKWWDETKKGNQLIRDYTATAKNVSYIDTTRVMLMADGKPDPDLFIKDMLHMNRKGYEKWIPVIREALEGKH